MNTNKRWTEEDNKMLVRTIKSNPHNIQKACEIAALKLDRTKAACVTRWYIISKNTHKTGVTFLAIGTNTMYENRKNSGNTHMLPKNHNIWMKLKKLLGLI